MRPRRIVNWPQVLYDYEHGIKKTEIYRKHRINSSLFWRFIEDVNRHNADIWFEKNTELC